MAHRDTPDESELPCDPAVLMVQARERLNSLRQQAANYGAEVGSDRYLDIRAHMALIERLEALT